MGAFPSVASAAEPFPIFSITSATPTVATPVGFGSRSASYDPKPPDHITLFVWSFGDGSPHRHRAHADPHLHGNPINKRCMFVGDFE